MAILPVPTGKGDIAYQGVAGEKRSQGNTAGEALDALTAQLPEVQDNLLVIVQSLRLDRFFNAVQQRRLGELMDAWRRARDTGVGLPQAEQAEMNGLIEAELNGAAGRSAALMWKPRRLRS